ncbi:MAG: hypothetical protein WDN26_09205 [Chitinophagaceae bacterium]
MKKWIKFFAGISFILFPGVIAAQDNFSKDLAALVKDTIYEFHNLQGKNIEDSGYYSALHEIVGDEKWKSLFHLYKLLLLCGDHRFGIGRFCFCRKNS